MTGPDRDPRERVLLLVLLAVSFFCLSALRFAEPDLWGHVRYGQDLLASGSLPATATHTFTAPDQPWINHEILAEVAMAVAANLAGASGLVLLKAILGLGLLALMIAGARRRGARPVALSIVVVLASINLLPGWTCRPQLFSWFFFLLVVLLLDRGFAGGVEPRFPRALWLIPPVFALWVNFHGGFVAGFLVLGLYLGVRVLEILAVRGRAGAGSAARCAAVLFASAVALLLNPYGIELLRWIVLDLAPARPEITEWQGLVASDRRFIPFALLVVVALIGTLGRTRPDPAEVAVLLVIAWQSVVHVRHIPFFAIAAGVWLPSQLDSLLARVRRAPPTPRLAPERPSRSRAGGPLLPVLVGATVLALVLVRGLKVDRASYPVDALQFMADRSLTGRLVVDFDWAQYALAAFAPETTVAFDGRFRTCYPQEIADMHFDFLLGEAAGRRWRSPASGPIDPTLTLRFRAPELVLIARRRSQSAAAISRAGNWTLLYQDDLAQVWGRDDLYDAPESPRFLPSAARRIGEHRPHGLVDWPAFPRGVAS